MNFTLLILALTAIYASELGKAHVTFDPSTSNINAYVVSAIRVPHGCADANGGPAGNTISVTVTIPDGVTSVKPKLTPGWNINIKMRALNPPITSHGKLVNETIDTVTWSGNTLPDAYFMDFNIQWKSPTATGRIYFPVNQTCDNNNYTNWNQIPASASESGSLAYPAPAVNLVDPTASTNVSTVNAKSSAIQLSVSTVSLGLGAVAAFTFF